MWPYVFMAWYLAKNKTKQKQGKPYADFWISWSGSFLSVLCLAHSHQLSLPDLTELSLHLSDTVVLCLGSASLCDCQKVPAHKKAASSGLTFLFSFSQWSRSCSAPCLICENSCFICLVQLSDCKSGICYTIRVQSWSPQLPDINIAILDFLRLLGVGTTFFWLFSLSFTLSLNFWLFFFFNST